MSDMVSIIVPVYNVEEYLRRCVDSLLNQTYNNIQIILVDDCSTDNSLNICKEYANSDARICLVHHEYNQGLIATRRTAMECAKGEWIMFLDSDDEYALDAVEVMTNFAIDGSLDMVFSSYTAIRNNQCFIEKANLNNGIYSRKQFIEHALFDVKWGVMSCIGSKIYRRSFLEDNNIFFDFEYKFNEDGAFMLSALKKSNRIGYINHPFYRYYQRESSSIQSSYRENMFHYISKTNCLLKELFNDNDLFDGVLKIEWSRKQLSLYLASLVNEVKYSNYHSFKRVFLEIKSSEDYYDVIHSPIKSGSALKITKLSLLIGFSLPLFLLLKAKLSIKGQ